MAYGLLICTLISENQGLEKSKPASNLRKISGPVNLDFFQIHSINLEKNPGLHKLGLKPTLIFRNQGAD